jgi:hypothetical protein
MNRSIVKTCVFAGLVFAIAGAALAQTPIPVKVVATGDVAGQALTWVTTTFGGVIGVALTGLLIRMFNNAGIQGAQLLSGTIQRIVVNGLNSATAAAVQAMAGKGQIDLNGVVNTTIAYVQQHAADELKRLGVDPTSPQAISGITARIMSAIVDPATPTHPALNGLVAAASSTAWPPSNTAPAAAAGG